MASKFCETCGTPIEEGAKFCPSCGKVMAAAQAPQPPVQQYQPPVQTYAPPVQPQYNPPPQQNFYQKAQDTSPMTVGQYVLTIFLSGIPLVGLVLLFVWAFSSSENINKRNYARAILIFAGIAIVLYILFIVVFGAFLGALFSGFSNGGGYGGY